MYGGRKLSKNLGEIFSIHLTHIEKQYIANCCRKAFLNFQIQVDIYSLRLSSPLYLPLISELFFKVSLKLLNYYTMAKIILPFMYICKQVHIYLHILTHMQLYIERDGNKKREVKYKETETEKLSMHKNCCLNYTLNI